VAITRERKEDLVEIYREILARTDGFIITDNRGLTVAKLDDLRNKLREASGTYMITKNTLFEIALRDNGWPVPEALLTGPSAVAFGMGNLPGIAKLVQAYAKDNSELFVVKGGVFGNAIFQAKDLEAVSNLPTMDELRAQLAGLIVQPASQLAGIIAAATGQIVNVVQAYLDDRQSGEEAA